MTTFWISAPITMAKELQALGVVLGPRVGEHWQGCQIPTKAAEDALLDKWGIIFFDGEPGFARREVLNAMIRKIRGEPEPAMPVKRKPMRRVK